VRYFPWRIIGLIIFFYVADIGKLFGPDNFQYPNWISIGNSINGEENSTPLKPIIVDHVSDDSVSRNPLLLWTPIDGAIYYELEFLNELPENPNGTQLSQYSVWSTREIYKNGYIADLSWAKPGALFWRVRALDNRGLPLGVYSDARQVVVGNSKTDTLRPFLTVTFNLNGMATPLFPVYAWIPVPGAVRYEVEVCSQSPENPNGIKPSKSRIWCGEGTGYDLYDNTPRNKSGTYYWRVRGLDKDGNPVGVYSNAGKYEVDMTKPAYSACFGDSITHGGGAISYSPSDWEYDFETYLRFPTVNLGRSGDTINSMTERFKSDVLPFRPKYLIILGGTNSIRGGTSGFEVIRELTRLRNMCEKQDIRPIFLTLPPINPEAIERVFGEKTDPKWRGEMDIVNHFIRQQKYYIDIAPYLSDSEGNIPEYYAIDGLHPDISGKKMIARLINENWNRVTR